MTVYSLPHDYGVNVFANDSGTISIVQPDLLGNDDVIIMVSPERVDHLIQFLQAVKEEIATMNADAAAEAQARAE